ncbi:MAG TPA: Ppx/GppA phosphatase family protein [Anaeromyxobacter sp.]|nr:Ppx/GppA phosphatase family protein [Anaeromyxobacter sp.]
MTAPERYATIDVGTNTVLLLVAERRGRSLRPIAERAEITRLGRGVDQSGRLLPSAIRDTVAVLADYARLARALGASDITCVATSAARDALNGEEFFAAARAAAGLTPQVISGEEEARLVHLTAWRDFGTRDGRSCPIAVLDVGGGSTEFIVGEGPSPRERVSLQVGAVRLTERHVKGDPIPPAELAALRDAARAALEPLTALSPAPGARLVGVAGTVTTLCAVEKALPRYDAERVHGAELSLEAVLALLERMARLTVAERAALPGMEPKRADVIVAGGVIVAEAMRHTGFDRLTVSDRGVRWGLVYDRLER